MKRIGEIFIDSSARIAPQNDIRACHPERSEGSIKKFRAVGWVLMVLMVAMTSHLSAKELGGNAGDIWTFGAGARSLGLANAAIELSDDATAGYWNPARLSYLSQMNFNFLHAALFEGAAYDYMGWAYPTMSAGTIGLNMVKLGIGGVEQRDENNNLLGDFSFASTGMSMSYGNQFGANFAFGGNLKYLTRTLPGASSSLMSFDLAADYRAFKYGEVGMVLRDVFYTASGTDDELPLNLTLGASYGLFEGALKTSLQFEQQGGVIRTGLEYGLGPAALRLGLGGVGQTAAGLGFRYRNIQLDYAIMIHELGNSSRFSMGFWFGTSRTRQRKDLSTIYSDRAQDSYRKGQFLRAYRLLDRALVFNPGDALMSARSERLNKIILYLRLTRKELPRRNAEDSPNKKRKYVYIIKGLSDYIEANIDGALLMLRQALSLDPGDEGLRKIYDTILEESGKKELKDVPMLSAEANIGAKLADADRFFRQGRFDMAAKACEDVVKLEPNNALALERLGSAYFALGLKEKAVGVWNKALELKPNNEALRNFLQRFNWAK